jgi:hypothetical protein
MLIMVQKHLILFMLLCSSIQNSRWSIIYGGRLDQEV